ncbi:hypothetical protein D3C86_1728660 [compost metagenome]
MPNRVMSPVTGRSSPVSAASRVDLPLPDGPSTAVMLPLGTCSETSRRIVRPLRSMRTLDNCTRLGVEADMGTLNVFSTLKHRVRLLNISRLDGPVLLHGRTVARPGQFLKRPEQSVAITVFRH